MAKRYVISMWMILYGLLCIGQQTKAGAVRGSALPGQQQSDIADAIDRWNRQFKWRTRDDSADLVRGSSIDIVHLKSPGEKDLIVTDQSGCSPTGNCTIFVLLPGKNEYRVVMEGIGRTYTIQPTRTKGFRNLELTMHGSATSSTIKVYKFNGVRYLRSSCYNEDFAEIGTSGDLQKLEKPKTTPCR